MDNLKVIGCIGVVLCHAQVTLSINHDNPLFCQMPFGLHQNTSLMRIFPALNKEIFLAMESFSLRFWRVVCLTACSRTYQLKVSVVSAVILLKLQNHLRNPRRAQHLIYIVHADNNFMMVWAVLGVYLLPIFLKFVKSWTLTHPHFIFAHKPES